MTSNNESDMDLAGGLPARGAGEPLPEDAGMVASDVVMEAAEGSAPQGAEGEGGVAEEKSDFQVDLRKTLDKAIQRNFDRVMDVAQGHLKRQKIDFTDAHKTHTMSVVTQANAFAGSLQQAKSASRVMGMTARLIEGKLPGAVWKKQESANKNAVNKATVVIGSQAITTVTKTKTKIADPLLTCNVCIIVSGREPIIGLNLLKKESDTTIFVPSNLDHVDTPRSVRGMTYTLCDMENVSDMENALPMLLIGGVKLTCQMPKMSANKLISHECQPFFSLVVPALADESTCEETYDQLAESGEEFGVFRVFVQVYMEHQSKCKSRKELLNVTDMYRKQKCGGYEYAVVSSLNSSDSGEASESLWKNVCLMLNETSVTGYILNNTFTPKKAEMILAAHNQPCEVAVEELERSMKHAVEMNPKSSVEKELFLTFRFELVSKCQKCSSAPDGVADEVITAMNATHAIKFTHVDNNSVVICPVDKVSNIFKTKRSKDDVHHSFCKYSSFLAMLKTGRESSLYDGHLQTVSQEDESFDWIFKHNSKLDLHYSFFSANLQGEKRSLTIEQLKNRNDEVRAKGGHVSNASLEFAGAACAAKQALTWTVYISPAAILELPLSMAFTECITHECYEVTFSHDNVGKNAFHLMILDRQETIMDISQNLVLPTLVFKTLVAFFVQKHVRDEEIDDVSIFQWAQQVWKELRTVKMPSLCITSEMYTGIWTLMHIMLSIIRAIDFAYALGKKIEFKSWGNIPGLNRADDIFTMVEKHRELCPNAEFKNAKLKGPHNLEFGPRHVYMILARWSDIFESGKNPSGTEVQPISAYFQATGDENFKKTLTLIQNIEEYLTPQMFEIEYAITDFQQVFPENELEGENVYTVGDDEELKNGPPCENLGLPGTWVEQNDVPSFMFTPEVPE